MKQLGLSEDLLNEALKVGIRTFEVDCCQLSQRVKSVNETWNTPTLSVIDDHGDPGENGNERLETESNLDMGEPDPASADDTRIETGPGHVVLGPGPVAENIEIVREPEIGVDAGL
jgi:hypothetical protein